MQVRIREHKQVELICGRRGVRAGGRAGLMAGLLLSAGLWGGCRMPSASLRLLDGLDTALGSVSAGEEVIRQAAMTQFAGQQQALDAAFEADMRNLAATSAPDSPEAGVVRLADVLTAKRLYDARRVEIQSGRQGVCEAFDRLGNNLSASRQMVDMLRRLVLQQYLLTEQADLAVRGLLSRPAVSAGPQSP